jgi:hypothetical protein
LISTIRKSTLADKPACFWSKIFIELGFKGFIFYFATILAQQAKGTTL